MTLRKHDGLFLVGALILTVALLLLACGGDGESPASANTGASGASTQSVLNSGPASAPSLPGLTTGANNDPDAPVSDVPVTGVVVTDPAPAGAGTSAGSAGGGSQPFVPNPADNQPPGTWAATTGALVEMGIGTYCWDMLCVDKIGVVTKGTLYVNRGDTIIVAVPPTAPPLKNTGVNAFPAENGQPLDDGSTIWPYSDASTTLGHTIVGDKLALINADLAPGTYVLSVFMSFESGDVVYGVLLEVQ